MYDELAFREYRLPLRGVAYLALAGAAVYAVVSFAGAAGALGIGGLTTGYLVARTTKF
jgi:hypothetical protein